MSSARSGRGRGHACAEYWDRCRRRVQQDLHGHRGRKGDSLYTARRTLHTGHGLLTDRHRDRLDALFAVEEHVELEATWASTSG